MSLLSDVKSLHSYYCRADNARPDLEFLDDKKLSFRIWRDNKVVREYIPSPTAIKFHQSRGLCKLLFGCFGSGKSVACMADIIIHSCRMPKCIDGVRRARYVLVRNSMPDLKASTLKTWEHWYDELGLVRKHRDSPYWYEIAFTDDEGLIEIEVYFLSGDENPKKLDKFLSTEFTRAYMNEASSLPEVLLDRLVGRIGRYPSKDICPEPFDAYILMDTNPPTERHWIHKIFEITKPEGYEIFKTPPGLLRDAENPGKYLPNPEADNIKNLPANYYINMALKGDENYIKVAALGEYGIIREGEPVYNCYNDNIHALEDIEIDWSEPLYLGHDYGLTPCCLVEQFIDGQLRSIQEFVSPFGTSVQELAETRVLPWLTEKAALVGMTINKLVIYSVGDPSDPLGSAVKISPSMVWNNLGIPTFDAPTNKISARINAVKFFMSRLVGGKPAYVISKSGCPVLREAHIAEYRYRKINTVAGEKLDEVPDKTHPFSDIEDAHQYVALICAGEYYSNDDQESVTDLMRQHGSVLSR